MSFESADGYQFKPHEMPFMPGSPASPEHPQRRKVAYLLIGIWVALTAGFQNGLLMASQTQLRGALGLTLEQDGWVQVAYYMTYACMSILFFKVRQHFGLKKFIRALLFLLFVGSIVQWFVMDFTTEIIARAISGIVASGMMTLGMFYIMQAFSGPKKLAAVMLSLGIMTTATPLAQVIVPFVFADGHLKELFSLSFIIAAITIVCVNLLPLPPSLIKPHALNRIDLRNFILYASGIALLCAFLVQGRIVWWSTSWLGYLLAGGIGLSGLALFLEWRRRHPMLDLTWISMPRIFLFAYTGALVRLLTSEQNVGAAGLLKSLGMTGWEMQGFYLVIFIASLLGVVISLLRLDLNDIRRPVVIALLGLTIGSYLDIHINVQTRPEQFYLSQAIIAFSALYFLGPMMIEGLARALSKSPEHIMSFSAVFGLSQSLGGLIGAALFSSFVTVRAREHLAFIAQHLTITDPNVANQIKLMSALFNPYSADNVMINSQAVSTIVAQATQEATVLAYSDLFSVTFVISLLAFLYAAFSWIFRKHKRIDILAQEKKRLARRRNA